MFIKKYSNLKSFIYPIRKYPSTCLFFTLIIFIISSAVFFIGITDDRGFNLKNYLIDSYIVGDFGSYEKSLSETFSSFIEFFKGNNSNNTSFAIGPIMPIFIWISRSISNNFFPYFIFSIYLSYWFIALSIDLARSFLPWFESQFLIKDFSLIFFNNLKIELSKVEIFGIIFNPILIYYVIFPASDLPFACLVLGIVIFFRKEKFLNCYLFYILSLLIRPTGLFLFPGIIFIFYYELKKRKSNKILIHIFITFFTFLIFKYYSEYSEYNFKDVMVSGGYGGGLSIWGLPIPRWIINQQGNMIFLINKFATVIFTPFIQLISVLGVRPSYTTIFDGNLSNALSIANTKPYFYAFLRILWGAIVTLPGFLLLLLNYLKFKGIDLFLFLIIIFSFGIGLSSSIPLERYLFFAFPLLSLSSISFYLEFVKNKDF